MIRRKKEEIEDDSAMQSFFCFCFCVCVEIL